MLNRAYSFEIKAFDDDKRIIEGLASTPSPDRMSDIVNPLGAKFALPFPFLWQHKHDKPIGRVIDVDLKKTGIPFKAQIESLDEPGTLKDRLDEAWQSLKLRLVCAVSIGFNPLKWSYLENGGIEFEEWDWLELSAVTIPANPDAAITAVKQLNRRYRETEDLAEYQIPSRPPAPDAIVKRAPVVRLGSTASVGAPYVIKKLHPERKRA